MPMIATIKFNDLFALSIPPCQTNSRHCGFSPRVAHAYLLDTRHKVADEFGHSHFEWIGNSEACAILSRVLYSFNDFSMRMPQNGRPPCANVIDIFISIYIPNMSASGLVNEEGLPSHGAKRPYRRIHTARDIF